MYFLWPRYWKKKIARHSLGLDCVITRNNDGTNTVPADVELVLGDGVTFRIPKRTVIESDGTLRVSTQRIQLVDEAGNITENFPPGHGIGFSTYNEETSQESSFDMIGAIEEQEKEDKSDTGCNSTGTSQLQMLIVLLFFGIRQQKRERAKSHDQN